MASAADCLLAIDVGTLSARAGVIDRAGALRATAGCGFELLRPGEGQAVYRMDEIWSAVQQAAREALAGAGTGQVAGIAFDATSSLVLNHVGAAPLAGGADVLCWMDHRGEAEAEEITRTDDRLLRYMGGSLSPEMHLPKLLWLKRRDPAAWGRVTGVRDLCDELARRATGMAHHSLCGLACKWAYLPDPGAGWCRDLLNRLGLADLLALGALEAPPLPVGAVHGRLTEAAAAGFGLPAGIPVAAGLIDAEAGVLGAVGARFGERINRTLALIGGTSTCLMAFAADERPIRGVWGPFRDAVFPGLWLHEAGQSLTGAALDAVLLNHPAGPRRCGGAEHAAAVREVMALLDAEGPRFATRRHVVPDWLGNRSPLGDGAARALLTGIGEETGRRSFLEAYYATARGIALQVRQVIGHMNAHGYALDRVALAGGHARNALMVRLYRDALGPDLVLGAAPEPVLLGTAIAAAVGAGWHADLFGALDAMSAEQRVLPADPRWRRAHDIAYDIYLQLFEARNRIERRAASLEEGDHR